MPTDWSLQFQNAIDEDDAESAWSVFLDAWKSNSHLDISADAFVTLFYDGDIAKQAVDRINQDPDLRLHLARSVTRYSTLDLSDRDVGRVYAAITDGQTMVEQWIERLRPTLSASKKAELAHTLIRTLLDQHGRKWVAEYLPSIWTNEQFLDEEREAIIVALERGGALSAELLRTMGPEAESLADRLIKQDRLKNYWRMGRSIPIIAGARASGEARSRVASLLNEISLNADLRDSGIKWNDQKWSLHQPQVYPREFGRFVEALRHSGRLSWREAEEWVTAMFSVVDRRTTMGVTLSFPVLRLLHLQQILSAPSLVGAIAAPEQFLLPEIFLYMLGQSGVYYVPEIRLSGNTDRRWRARWAEATAEAIAVIFMERAVAMELSTLARIPETNKGPTPDFQAQSIIKEPIVFEVKGATHWGTHTRQKNEARLQLRKGVASSDEQAGSNLSWDLGGQAFACCLFAAEHGASKSSLFHVADPPFPFQDVFVEGWEDRARRHHYAAVLESCEEYALADYLLERRREETTRKETQRLSIPFGEESVNFVGRYDALDIIARRIGHPAVERFRGVQVFRGIDEGLYRALESSEAVLPPPPEPKLISVGTVPTGQGGTRGVYSCLSDGAILAVVAE